MGNGISLEPQVNDLWGTQNNIPHVKKTQITIDFNVVQTCC